MDTTEGHREESTNEKNHKSIDVPFHIGGLCGTSGMVGIEFEGSIG